MINFLHTNIPDRLIIALGPINIYWYGLFIVLGVLLAIFIAIRLSKKFGVDSEIIFDLAFWLILGGVLGARIYHVIEQADYYLAHPGQIFLIWQGGLAIHGAIISGMLILWFYAKKQHLDFWLISAILAPALALGQAVGRWGNYFNQEAFGLPTYLPWGIPISIINRPVKYISSDFFHPTFLYESIGNLVIFILLWCLARKVIRGSINNKYVIIAYLFCYSLLRFVIEFWRVDSEAVWGKMKFVQIISLVIMLACLVFAAYLNKERAVGQEEKNR